MSDPTKHVRCHDCNGYADATLKALCHCGWTNREDGEWRCPNCSRKHDAPPHWTTTPPTESGWYWRRSPLPNGRRTSATPFRVHVWVKQTAAEWWPVPIPEPPRGDEK